MAECVRKAWLILGTTRLDLEDDTAGYYCTELDLGYPEVREVMDNRPDLDGVDDRTALFGSRAMAATITARGGTMSPDQIGSLFARYMLPGVRPELHYVLDRPGAPERRVIVRASDYAWPISGANTREIHLGWVAADPAMEDPVTKTAIAWAGSTGSGRVYALTFNRIYPAGGSASTSARISSPGDVPIRPLFRFYGPHTAPAIQLQPSAGGTMGYIGFEAGFIIPAGQWVDVDAAKHTAYANSDPAQSVIDQIRWDASTWPVLPVAPAYTTMWYGSGSSTSGVTQVQAIWNDRYLS